MNIIKPMQMHQPERSEAKQSPATDEKLLAALDEIELLREQVESWRKQVESLNQESRAKDLELQEIQKELKHTNHELFTAFMFEKVSLAEAVELATEILTCKKSANKSLSQLLNAIYGSQVKPEELGKIDKSSITRIARTSAIADKEAADLNEYLLEKSA